MTLFPSSGKKHMAEDADEPMPPLWSPAFGSWCRTQLRRKDKNAQKLLHFLVEHIQMPPCLEVVQPLLKLKKVRSLLETLLLLDTQEDTLDLCILLARQRRTARVAAFLIDKELASRFRDSGCNPEKVFELCRYIYYPTGKSSRKCQDDCDSEIETLQRNALSYRFYDLAVATPTSIQNPADMAIYLEDKDLGSLAEAMGIPPTVASFQNHFEKRDFWPMEGFYTDIGLYMDTRDYVSTQIRKLNGQLDRYVSSQLSHLMSCLEHNRAYSCGAAVSAKKKRVLAPKIGDRSRKNLWVLSLKVPIAEEIRGQSAEFNCGDSIVLVDKTKSYEIADVASVQPLTVVAEIEPEYILVLRDQMEWQLARALEPTFAECVQDSLIGTPNVIHKDTVEEFVNANAVAAVLGEFDPSYLLEQKHGKVLWIGHSGSIPESRNILIFDAKVKSDEQILSLKNELRVLAELGGKEFTGSFTEELEIARAHGAALEKRVRASVVLESLSAGERVAHMIKYSDVVLFQTILDAIECPLDEFDTLIVENAQKGTELEYAALLALLPKLTKAVLIGLPGGHGLFWRLVRAGAAQAMPSQALPPRELLEVPSVAEWYHVDPLKQPPGKFLGRDSCLQRVKLRSIAECIEHGVELYNTLSTQDGVQHLSIALVCENELIEKSVHKTFKSRCIEGNGTVRIVQVDKASLADVVIAIWENSGEADVAAVYALKAAVIVFPDLTL